MREVWYKIVINKRRVIKMYWEDSAETQSFGWRGPGGLHGGGNWAGPATGQGLPEGTGRRNRAQLSGMDRGMVKQAQGSYRNRQEGSHRQTQGSKTRKKRSGAYAHKTHQSLSQKGDVAQPPSSSLLSPNTWDLTTQVFPRDPLWTVSLWKAFLKCH